MEKVIKNQNISIQPLKVLRTFTEEKLVLSEDNLTQAEINRRSTSNKIKRRIAHVAKYPVPAINKPTTSAGKPENPKPKNRKQKKPKEEKPENAKSKKVQNLGTQHKKMTKIRNFVASIPWAYSDIYFGRNLSEKRKLDDLEDTPNIAKKQKKTDA